MVWNFKPQMRAYRFVGHKVSVVIDFCVALVDYVYFDPLTFILHGQYFVILTLACTVTIILYLTALMCKWK